MYYNFFVLQLYELRSNFYIRCRRRPLNFDLVFRQQNINYYNRKYGIRKRAYKMKGIKPSAIMGILLNQRGYSTVLQILKLPSKINQ